MIPSMRVDGLADCLRRLRAAPEQLQTKVLRGAVGAMAEVIRAEAEIRAPIYSGRVGANHPPPGTLKRAIYKARLTSASTATLETWLVSARKGKGQQAKGMDAYYATWVEYGTLRMAARPYMRPAFEAKKEEATRAGADFIAARLAAALGTGAVH